LTEPRDDDAPSPDPAPPAAGEDSGSELLPTQPPRGEDWEVVLHAAAEPVEPPAPGALPPPAPRPWTPWLRAAAPLLILVAYGIFKLVDGDASPRRSDLPEAPASLSGVDAQREGLKLDRETEALVARLEALAARSDWQGLAAATAAAGPAQRDHPVVRAFALIARVEQGDRSTASWRQLQELDIVFQGSDRHRALRDYLRLLKADVLLRTAKDPDALMRNMDKFRQFLSGAGLTPRVLELRLDLAAAYEAAGVDELEAAGSLRPDRVRLANARSLLQQGMRWVTREDAWIQRLPIDTGQAAARQQRLELHLRTANARFHGPALPFTGKDSETWSGRSDEPVHDYPGGAW
jgi:hypothetical protein